MDRTELLILREDRTTQEYRPQLYRYPECKLRMSTPDHDAEELSTAELVGGHMPSVDSVRGQEAAVVETLCSGPVSPNFAAILSNLHNFSPGADQEEVAAPVLGLVMGVAGEVEEGSCAVLERKAGVPGHIAGARPS